MALELWVSFDVLIIFVIEEFLFQVVLTLNLFATIQKISTYFQGFMLSPFV